VFVGGRIRDTTERVHSRCVAFLVVDIVIVLFIVILLQAVLCPIVDIREALCAMVFLIVLERPLKSL